VRDALVIPDRFPNAFMHMPSGGWVWLRSGRPEISVQLRADTSSRRIPFPAWYGVTFLADLSRDGRFVAFVSSKARNADSVRVSVLSLADSAVTPWFTAFGGMSEVSWLNDGTLLVVFIEALETYSVYHLLGPGRAEKLGTIPRRVSSVSVSKDMKHAAVVVRDHRGDAWMSRVVRR
jgi:Tol biopolymer transport system component